MATVGAAPSALVLQQLRRVQLAPRVRATFAPVVFARPFTAVKRGGAVVPVERAHDHALARTGQPAQPIRGVADRALGSESILSRHRVLRGPPEYVHAL